MTFANRAPAKADVAPGRLTSEAYGALFDDAHPPLTAHEALVAADRCYFCHDAPCVTACPTGIDVPLFIRQIGAGQPEAAAETILAQNVFGGMCARVCPVETLCEGACVREAAEGRPVEIGRLQRHATDAMMTAGETPFRRAASTGRSVAVVGAGPAGLACAHRLALGGHEVVVLEARPRAGGLNEHGIAAYKTPGRFARAEIEWLLSIGGIRVETGRALGRDLTLDGLREEFDAVFLGLGLAGVNALGVEGDALDGVADAVDFIAELRQAADLSALPIGRRVVVIGGGMTAIDAAVQARRLGAEEVTIVHRRARLGATRHEQARAAAEGVAIRLGVRPVRVLGGSRGGPTAVEVERVREGPEGPVATGERFAIEADQVLRAIGQRFEPGDPLALDRGRIRTDAEGRTSIPGVWAGGDCVAAGDDLTVWAVAQGRDAAESIHRALAAPACIA